MYKIQFPNFLWIDLKNPQPEDAGWLSGRFKLHPLVLKELLPPLDHPKLENFGEYLSLVIFYPFFDKKNYCTLPLELDIIVGRDFIVTSHYQDMVPLKAIFDRCNLYEENRQAYAKNGPGEVLYRVLREIMLACFPKLNHIKKNIESIEELIYQGSYQKAVSQISLVRRDIIGFQKIMEPQYLVFKNLAKESELFFSKELLPYFHSLLILYDQVKNILEMNDRTLSSLDSTNQSLLSTRTNEIMKVLTILSVIVYPFTLISDILSMNGQYLRWSAPPETFWPIFIAMVSGAVLIFSVFKHKKWI
ncbi:MAG: magnesium transporter CorA family protein [Candidatus Pacebacteria bacterium]|nr:magnesium transporter CorA family protein [Candidatus Paceibacterota bacterium]